MRKLLLLLVGVSFATGTLAAQAPAQAPIGRQATPEEVSPGIHDIPSPMLLEFSLSKPGGKPLSDVSVRGRTYYDTKSYCCDKMQIPKITVMKKDKRDGGIDLEVTPLLKTEWPRQDINLRVALVTPDGKEIQFKTWENLTIGADDSTANKLTLLTPFAAAGGSSSKMPAATFSFGKGDFEKLFEAEAPRLRIIVAIQE
jgi:hypothetical protein